MAKSGLGRGLGALLGGASSVERSKTAPGIPSINPAPPGETVISLPLDRISPSALQPRKDFLQESLDDLANSIREQGIVQPLLVRRRGEGYELIAGERRWRAARMAGLAEAPALVREVDDLTALELMLIENLQREDLNPVEEALGYQQLMAQFHLRQEDVALKVGRSRASVANALRLLKLDPSIQSMIRDGRLSVGHAKALLSLESPDRQRQLAERVVESGMSVREVEAMAARTQTAPPSSNPEGGSGTAPLPRDVHIVDLEERLQQRFGSRVQLRYRKGKGSVTIQFFSDEDLSRLLEIFSVKVD